MGAILKERDYVGIALGVISFLAAGCLCWWALTTKENWRAVFAMRRSGGRGVTDERGVEMRDLERGTLERGERGSRGREVAEGGRGEESVGDEDEVWTTIRM